MTERYRYIDPKDPENGDWSAVIVTMTRDEILGCYFKYWSGQMIKVGKADLITADNCIEDWIVLHWAERVPE